MAATDILQLLWGAARQDNRMLRLHTALGGDTLVAERLDGVESVDGDGFRFELTALSADAHLDLDTLLGTPVLIELMCADSRHDLRPFHGHATSVERIGSNGGMARYRFVVEPWLALLRYRKDSYVYRDMSAIEIVEAVFGHYASGVVRPAWRWELADRERYPKRSLTSQYQESDLAFVTRLLAEEGIFRFFEHTGDADANTLGTHTLVLADSNEVFQSGEAVPIRFHRSDATERDDTIQHWAPRRRWQGGRVARASWDYRTLSMRPAGAEADGPTLDAIDDDTAGPYAWIDARQGADRARQHLDARHVDSELVEGDGSVRRMAPGTSFTLTGHATQGAEPLACLRVHHHARNNLDADVRGQAENLLGAAMAAASGESTDEAGEADTDFYRNTFIALPARRPYRPRTPDGHGLRRHPRASASGAQSAIVVGNGDPVHTDRDHRVIVQQHWQRGGNGAGGLEHPREADAPADAGAGTWARVATVLAGANWGSHMLPRVGQEVWLDYLEGDIDRPVIVASLYNGRGNDDAPHNRVAGGPSGATGNAAAWFTGNDHAGVLSGFKTQDLASSATGAGGYRQLRFDDTPGQGHVQLATTDDDTALTLGHFKHLEDNAREADLGYGAALATQAQGALRGGAGLYLTSARGQGQMDAAASIGVLDAQRSLTQSLADVAQQQQAGLDDEPAADKLNAVAAQQQLGAELAATRDSTSPGAGIGGGDGTAIAWSKPHLVIHGQDGLATVTPENHLWVSGTDTILTAGKDINLAAQGELSLIAAHGIALYTQGSEGRAPITETGIKLHAATGKVSIQAQQDKAGFAAQKAVTLVSTDADVQAQANTHLLLTAAGAYLKIKGGDIEIGAPGKVEFKGAQKELSGGAGGQVPQVALAKAEAKLCQYKTRKADEDGEGVTRAA